MSDAIQTIEFLAAKARAKQEELISFQKLINGLCVEANIPPRYPNICELSDSADGGIRRDQFYGQSVTNAARSYLEMRRARGAASINDIFKAIRDGGFKFDTKDEENAKTTLRSNLRKNSAVFHRLPNGDYGLLSWYPNAKPTKSEGEDEDEEEDEAAEKPQTSKPAAKASTRKESNNAVGNADIRATILTLSDRGTFTSADVEKEIAIRFPGRHARDGAVSILINRLKKKDLVKVVTERSGSSPATYGKA